MTKILTIWCLLNSIFHYKTKNGNHPNLCCWLLRSQEQASFLWTCPASHAAAWGFLTQTSSSLVRKPHWTCLSFILFDNDLVSLITLFASSKQCYRGQDQCHQPLSLLLTNQNFTDELLHSNSFLPKEGYISISTSSATLKLEQSSSVLIYTFSH